MAQSFLTVSACHPFSLIHIHNLSLFFSLYTHIIFPVLSPFLCSCQSVGRAGQTHSHPQRVTQSGHCQQGLLTAWHSLPRADTGDTLCPCCGGSWWGAPGVAPQILRVVIKSTVPDRMLILDDIANSKDSNSNIFNSENVQYVWYFSPQSLYECLHVNEEWQVKTLNCDCNKTFFKNNYSLNKYCPLLFS